MTEQQLNERRAPCPRCGKLINVVPNRATKQATLSAHSKAAPPPASRLVKTTLKIAKLSGQLEF